MNKLLDKRILVIGSNSFIGKSLITELAKYNCKIIGVSSSSHVDNQNLSEFHQVEWSNQNALAAVVSTTNPDYLIHLAANKKRTASAEENTKIVEDNVVLSTTIIHSALKLDNLKKLIFFGTCDEYGTSLRPYSENNAAHPINAYGEAKLKISNLILDLIETRNFPGLIIRPSVVYGPGQPTDMLVPKLISELIAGRPFPMSPGDQTRDYLYVDDLSHATINLMTSELVGLFNVASEETVKMKDVTKKITHCLNLNFSENVILGATPYRENEILDYAVSIKKISELLKWKPTTTLDVGLQKTVDFYKKS